jgi:hypothetical protein
VKLKSKSYPIFNLDEIKFICSEYENILKIISTLRNDENIKKNKNIMHCKHYIVKIVQKYIPNKKEICVFVVPPTNEVRKIVNYVWDKYMDQKGED